MFDNGDRASRHDFDAALHSLETADLLAHIDPLNPEVGRPFMEVSAEAVQRTAGQILHDKLSALGFSDDEMTRMTEDDLLHLAPEEMANIRKGIQGVSSLGASALSSKVYETDREFGRTHND